MFRLVKRLKTDSDEFEGGSEKERGKVWKDYMERIMNEENDWHYDVEGDAVEGALICESREEKPLVVQMYHWS